MDENRNCISKKIVDIVFVAAKVFYCNAFFYSFHFRRASRIPLYEFGPVQAVSIGSVDLALLLTFAFWQQKYDPDSKFVFSYFESIWGWILYSKSKDLVALAGALYCAGRFCANIFAQFCPCTSVQTCSTPCSPTSVPSFWAQDTKDTIWCDW